MHEILLLSKALLFLATLLGLGCGLARLPFLPRRLGLFELVTLGFGGALALAFWLATAGLLSPFGAVSCAALAAAFLLLHRQELLLLLRERQFSRTELLPALLLGVVLLPPFWIAINPGVNWDAAVYHLTLPKLYLESGGFEPLEMSVYSVWPHGPQLLYAFGLLGGGPALAKLLHFGCGLLVLGGLYHSLRRSHLPLWRFGAWVAMAAFLVHPLVLFELQTAYVDLAQAVFFFAAFLALLRAVAAAKTPQPEGAAEVGAYLLVAGIAGGGVAVGKPTGVLFLLALLPLLLPALLPDGLRDVRRQSGRASWLFLTHFLPPVLIFWLPWLWRAFRATGNPFYPFFWQLFGGPDWSTELAGQFLAWQREIGMGRTPLDYLLLPWRVLTAGDHGYPHFDGRLALPTIALLALALFRAARPAPPFALRPALAVSGLFFVLWALSSQQMRFLIPILPLLALAAGLAAADLAAGFGRRTLLGPTLALLLPLTIFAGDPTLLRKGLQHAAIYRDPRYVDDPWAAAPPWRQPLQGLAADAKVLMLNWNQGYYCPRPFLADSFFEASQIRAWLQDVPREKMAAALRQRGVTHILLGPPRPVHYPPALLQLLGERREVRPIWSSPNGEWAVFELVP